MSDIWRFHPKYVLNGFPKAGLHLVATMIEPICPEVPAEGLYTRAWAGTFRGKSWTNERLPIEQTTYLLSRLRIASHIKGHLGYDPNISRFLWLTGAAVVFIYRDFRDVAVSQAYHILDDELYHPDKELYRQLGSFDEVLKAVIVGLEGYPGIFERWVQFAPWLDVEWVHKVHFEEAIEDRAHVAGEILKYGLRRTTAIWNYEITFQQEALDAAIAAMVEASHDTDRSATFRKGVASDWREHFTEEIKDLFKAADKEKWLQRLSYENDDNW